MIRRAQNGDAPAVTELLRILGYHSNIAAVERRLADCAASPDTTVLVAEFMRDIVGLLSFHCIPLFHTDGSLGRITSLVVAPEYRGRGVGRLLIAAAEEFARTRGCARVEVTQR